MRSGCCLASACRAWRHRAELQTPTEGCKRAIEGAVELTSDLGPSGSLQQAISFLTGKLPFTIWPTISRPRPLLAPVISTFTDRAAAIFSDRSCSALLCWGSKECLVSFSPTHFSRQPGFGFLSFFFPSTVELSAHIGFSGVQLPG